MISKNVAGQKVIIFAYDKTTGVGKTGDAANITALISKDGAATGASSDVNPVEIAGGYYAFDISQAESNCDLFLLIASSATGNILVDAICGYTDRGYIDAAISSRSIYAGADTAGTGTLLTRIPGNLTITGGKVDVNDKTGFALTAGEHTTFSTERASTLTAQGLTTTRAGYLDTLNGIVTAIWANATRTLSAFGFSVTASTVSDKTGYSLSVTPPTAAQIRTEIDTNSTKLDATISSRFSGGAVASVTNPVTVGTNNDKTGYTVSSNTDKTGYSISGTKTTLDALNDISNANVLTQVNAALDSGLTELTGIPAFGGPPPQVTTLRRVITALYQYFFLKRTATAAVETMYKSDSATSLATSSLSDDNTTAIHGKIG